LIAFLSDHLCKAYLAPEGSSSLSFSCITCCSFFPPVFLHPERLFHCKNPCSTKVLWWNHMVASLVQLGRGDIFSRLYLRYTDNHTTFYARCSLQGRVPQPSVLLSHVSSFYTARLAFGSSLSLHNRNYGRRVKALYGVTMWRNASQGRKNLFPT
jgi:hypothetical protein